MRRTLDALLADPEGRLLLEEHGVTASVETFAAALRPPAHPRLQERLGVPTTTHLVYVGHQLLADYAASVVAKLVLLRDLGAEPSVVGVLVWLDTYRVASERRAVTWQWPLPPQPSVRLAARRYRGRELRFVPADTDQLDTALQAVAGWRGGDGDTTRLEALRHAVLAPPAPTRMDDVNLRIAGCLVGAGLGVPARSVVVSDLLHTVLRDGLTTALAAIDDVVAVFNERVESLRAADVDPQVDPLPADYLPLHHSCPVCHRRSRLRHQQEGSDHGAVSECLCGQAYRFHLGRDEAGLGELVGTRNWSTDVTMPAYLNGLVSGVVAGRSSALYGLVLNDVVERVLGQSPVPMLVPEPEGAAAAIGTDSLLYDYLTGS